MRTRAAAVVAGVVLSLAALAGCSAPGGTAGSPDPARTHATARTVAPPTCTGILAPATVRALTAQGWSPRQDPFFIGNARLHGGIQCTWGDAAHPNDDVQVYGWAPVTRAQATKAENELAGTGWRRLTQGDDTCYTATGDMIVNPDSDGFGMTYCFAARQVTVADTKQGLLLVQWPR